MRSHYTNSYLILSYQYCTAYVGDIKIYIVIDTYDVCIYQTFCHDTCAEIMMTSLMCTIRTCHMNGNVLCIPSICTINLLFNMTLDYQAYMQYHKHCLVHFATYVHIITSQPQKSLTQDTKNPCMSWRINSYVHSFPKSQQQGIIYSNPSPSLFKSNLECTENLHCKHLQ